MSSTAAAPPPKVVLIVGGGQGIGLETTRYLLSKAPRSVNLVIFGLHIDEGLRRIVNSETTTRLHLLQGDATKPADRQRAIQICLDVAGTIDSLVYCAGLMTPIQRIESLDLDAVRSAYELNVFGVMAIVSSPRIRSEHRILVSFWLTLVGSEERTGRGACSLPLFSLSPSSSVPACSSTSASGGRCRGTPACHRPFFGLRHQSHLSWLDVVLYVQSRPVPVRASVGPGDTGSPRAGCVPSSHGHANAGERHRGQVRRNHDSRRGRVLSKSRQGRHHPGAARLVCRGGRASGHWGGGGQRQWKGHVL